MARMSQNRSRVAGQRADGCDMMQICDLGRVHDGNPHRPGRAYTGRAYNGRTSTDPAITGELSEERSDPQGTGSVEPSGAGPSQPQ